MLNLPIVGMSSIKSQHALIAESLCFDSPIDINETLVQKNHLFIKARILAQTNYLLHSATHSITIIATMLRLFKYVYV